jgi:hypothetical protein
VRKAIAIPPISIDTASWALVGRVVVMDEKYPMEKVARILSLLWRPKCFAATAGTAADYEAFRWNLH